MIKKGVATAATPFFVEWKLKVQGSRFSQQNPRFFSKLDYQF
jgi:hypothetical protein